MKKIYLSLTFFIFCGLIASAQCPVDTSNTTVGFSPAFVPPIVEGIAYDTFVQEYMPAWVNNGTDTMRILSTRVDTILGFPAGIGYSRNPASVALGAGGRQCLRFYGATLDSPGTYPLLFIGSAHIISATLGDTVLSLPDFGSVLVDSYSIPAPFQYSLQVVQPYIRGCTVDTTLLTNTGVNPVASAMPCIVRNVPYDQTVQGKIQHDSTTTIAGISVLVTVDSVEIDSIHGMPVGITFGRSPMRVKGGGYGCVNFAGTTTDTTGKYQLTAYGTAWLTATGAGQTFHRTLTGDLNQYSSFGGYYLRVVNAGDSCSIVIPNGIKDYSRNLNALVSVFPNPNSGVFGLTINAVSAVTGQLLVYNAVGQKVYEKPVDIAGVYTTTINLSSFGTGLYTLQISTPNGSVVKRVSVE